MKRSVLFFLDWRKKMSTKFYEDLKNARKAEKIALDVLSYLGDTGYTVNYAIEDVSADKEYWHLGDLKLIDNDNNILFIDVKDDKVIHKYKNILVEERVYYRKEKKYKEGWIYSGYNYLAIVNRPTKKIYLINFDKLKKHYKEGKEIRIQYSWQFSDCHLLPLKKAEELGIVEAVIDYEDNKKESYPIKLERHYH